MFPSMNSTDDNTMSQCQQADHDLWSLLTEWPWTVHPPHASPFLALSSPLLSSPCMAHQGVCHCTIADAAYWAPASLVPQLLFCFLSSQYSSKQVTQPQFKEGELQAKSVSKATQPINKRALHQVSALF